MFLGNIQIPPLPLNAPPVRSLPVRQPLRSFILSIATLLSPLLSQARAADQPKFAWKNGDRVVLIGDTLIEREQAQGYLETLLTARNPDKSITFRNLGWSGDTVFGTAQAGFGTPTEGFKHVVDHVLALKPTVLILGYGMAESFDGKAGLPAFTTGFNTLLDALSPTNARLIFLSPIAHEDLGRPLPDPTNHNLSLDMYRDAIKSIAHSRKAHFIDLYAATRPPLAQKNGPLTDNGIHPTPYGYWSLANLIAADLCPESEAERDIHIDVHNSKTSPNRAKSIKVDDLEVSPDQIHFSLTAPRLPLSLPPKNVPSPASRTLTLSSLPPGIFKLAIDGKAITSASSESWSKGVAVTPGPEFEAVDALRKAVIAKNELYFYRWRPQNETYLFGFRKHEQGNNASEIPKFDPLVETLEKEIASLRLSRPHAYVLTRESKAAK